MIGGSMAGLIDNHTTYSSFDAGIRSATANNREDLMDAITIVSPTETPLLSGLSKVVCHSVMPEWLIDSLETRGDPDVGNADVQVVPESFDAEFVSMSPRKRLKNYTHIFRKTVDVSDTQRAVDTAGTSDEYEYRIQKALKELAIQIEFALMHSVMQSQSEVGNIGGTPATGRKMEGILHWIEPDPAGVSANYLDSSEEGTITEAGSPIGRLSEIIYNNHLQAMWDKGTSPRTAYCQKIQKREISGFTTNVTRNINASELRQIANIDVYQGDFGTQAILLNRDMPTREVLTIDEDYLQIATLRPILITELARAGNSTRCMIEAELTLKALSPATMGKIVWCSDTYYATH